MKGKDKCNLLKSIRCKIARENGIDYQPAECHFQGECKGTCPRCEAELQKLTLDLQKLKNTGKRVAVAGIATAMVAGTAAGCVPRPLKEPENPTTYETYQTTGSIAVTEESTVIDGELPSEEIEGKIIEESDPAPDEFELTGDVAFPEETNE